MRKASLLLMLMLVLSVFSIILLSKTAAAAYIDPSNPEDPLGLGFNPADMPSDPQQFMIETGGYIYQKFIETMYNTGITPTLKGADSFWNFALGVKFSWTFYFILTAVIFLLLVIYLFRVFQGIMVTSGAQIKGINILMFFIALVIIWLLSISKILSALIVSAVNGVSDFWTKFIIYGAIVFGMFIAIAFSSGLRKIFEEETKETRLKKAEKESEKARAESKKARQETKETQKLQDKIDPANI